MQSLLVFAVEFNVDLIAIGNGTASRETEALIAEMMTANADLNLTRVSVSEAGASVYSRLNWHQTNYQI